ncbi:uncharacterized protein LOC119067406 [Bradysia coprophila]|uniref:uncharacterized protein LOC119067406 n=1 Tax=Bradysia coprophila TaxID=38358 RepID=UPI00187DC193|nr:uncharacterized protein LOC119067406 [Bradysia coprophila]
MQSSIIFTTFSIILCGIVGKCSCNSSSSSCRYLNEEYAVDARRPQNTCEYYGCYGQVTCPGSSSTGECYCKKGYARIFAKGPCISIAHPYCAQRLPPTPEVCQSRPNEVYKEYADSRQCENTCANYDYNCGNVYTYAPVWKPWCDCVEDYARLPNGKCVPVSDPECMKQYQPSVANCWRRGQEIYRVGQICEAIPTCEYPNGPEVVCMAIGPMPRCYCKAGELRNAAGKCVPADKC